MLVEERKKAADPLVKRIKYIGFWDEFDPEEFKMTKILRKHFHVEICDEDPDYVICSCIRNFYEITKYPQVRIMYIGENYIPDMNIIDYSICPYPVKLLDRCFHLPQGLKADNVNKYCSERHLIQKFDHDFLKEKTVFANFCASHESEYSIRGDFFKKLCEYKKVDSIGTYLNNTGVYVKCSDGTKREYQKKCKFTLCFESTAHGGFNTEKITDAFCSDTIPVYYGDPYIGDIFNKKAFINVADYDSFEDAIDKIIELDNDDEKYLEMLRQPVFNDSTYTTRLEEEYEKFLIHIFEQPIEKAYRRSRVYFASYFNSWLKNCYMMYNSHIVQLAVKLKKKIFH